MIIQDKTVSGMTYNKNLCKICEREIILVICREFWTDDRGAYSKIIWNYHKCPECGTSYIDEENSKAYSEWSKDDNKKPYTIIKTTVTRERMKLNENRCHLN